jgi:hypothetical protein
MKRPLNDAELDILLKKAQVPKTLVVQKEKFSKQVMHHIVSTSGKKRPRKNRAK